MKQNENKKFVGFKTQMDSLIENLKNDMEKFYDKENKAAGMRLRKGLKAIKEQVKEASGKKEVTV